MRREKKRGFFFCHMCPFFPRHSVMKLAVQLDLSLDHMPRAAAVAQKGESGGAVLKTNTKEEYLEREGNGY